MKDKKTEKISLWDYLKTINNTKPIILYGMGNGADKILDLCEKKDIKINDIFASDEFVRGHHFRGFRVKKLSEIEEEYKDFCILTAFATRENEVIDRIYKLSEKYELYSPNFPVFGEKYFDCDFLSENIKDIEKAYLLLSDGISREVYINAINFMISGKLKYLKNINSLKYDAFDLLNLCDEVHYIDIGAYNGDTVLELIKYLDAKNININKITAFEPDKKNFEKLEKNMIENNIINKCGLYNTGAWSEEKTLFFDSKSGRSSSVGRGDTGASLIKSKSIKISVNSLDNILKFYDLNRKILIKYDVEGAEFEALTGTKETIKKYSPKLSVSLYHRAEDIFKLLLLINNINPDYNFYMRKHKYIPCWDLNLYAVHKNFNVYR
ncbi:MAG: FkbM family methyltransferase [Oscillospiraceae bacterium]|nr:FkbM family methyltransferase [Oscillospiraceae bacterium]